jgi:hypothetical protein
MSYRRKTEILLLHFTDLAKADELFSASSHDLFKIVR